MASSPDNADGHRILGHLLAATGDTSGAEDAWRAALTAKPDDLESSQALALSLFGAPAASAEAASATASAAAKLLRATAAALTAGGIDLDSEQWAGWERRLSAASLRQLEALRSPALELRRQYRRQFALSCVAARRVASWADADDQTRRLETLLLEEAEDPGAPTSGPPSLDPAFALVVPLAPRATVDLSRASIRFFHPEASAAPPPERPRSKRTDEGQRLKVGYIGSEFGDKPVGHLLHAIISATDDDSAVGGGLESFVYQLAAEPALPSLQELVGERRMRHMPLSAQEAGASNANSKGRGGGGRVAQIEEVMATDGLDVVVDMLGWSTELQATIAKRGHGAALTLSMLSYPATRAAPYIDGLVGDAIVAPPELHGTAYGEPVHFMPYSYHVADQRHAFPSLALDDAVARTQPDFSWLPDPSAPIESRGLVLCNFNSEWRVTPSAWSVWLGILRRLNGASGAGSVLWQIGTVSAAVSNLRQEMAAGGIATERLALTEKRSRSDHLAVAPACDLHLDTPEHNAHSTGLDAMWAGVPLLTVPKDTFASRVGASLVSALGLGWHFSTVASSLKEYEDFAVHAGSNRTYLGGVRRALADARHSAPLYDTQRWAQSYMAELTERSGQ